MLPVNCGSHADYQNFVVTNLRKYYPNPDALAPSTWDIIERFWNLDLSYTDEFMKDKYSKFGPAPRTPSCMQRSYLLSIDFKLTSLTEWAAQLKINPLYAILSGFDVGSTPGVGTFYGFFNRLWDSDDDYLSSHIHPLKEKVKKPKTKGTKADSVEKVTVAELLPQLENTSFHLDGQPYASLFKIYKKSFLDTSVSKGLIKPEAIALAGDGTPVVTSHRQRKKRICSCAGTGITNLTALVTAIFPSLTAIQAGIHPVTAIIMVMIYTCWLHQTLKVTCLCFLIFHVLQHMILMDFHRLFPFQNLSA